MYVILFNFSFAKILSFHYIQVQADGKAAAFGVQTGDIVVATSATAGDQLWNHSTADGVKSALSTRFVMNPTVRLYLRIFMSYDQTVDLTYNMRLYTY